MSDEYGWDKTVFENAYNKVLESNFIFKIECPPKQSRDRKKIANLIIEKTETVTSVYVKMQTGNSSITKKLFDKKNQWWHDCVYLLARQNKWFDSDRFGVAYGKGKIEIWYSLEKNDVELYENGDRVTEIDFGKYFMFN